MSLRHISQIIPEALKALGVNAAPSFPELDEHTVKHEACFTPPISDEEIEQLNFEMQNDLSQDRRIWEEYNVFDNTHPNGTKCQHSQ